MTYTITDTFVDAEDLAKEWLLSVASVTSLVGLNGAGRPNVYLGMPKGSPLPEIEISRSGGAPSGGEVPEDFARITANVWASNRPQAKAITQAVVSAAQSLKGTGLFVGASGAKIHAAQVMLVLFLPDPGQPEVPRYVVDMQLTVTSS